MPEKKGSEPEKTVMISTRGPASLRKRLRQHALDTGTSVQAIVLEAIAEYLNKKKRA